MALVSVPLVLLLGITSGRISNSGYGNSWFDALSKPSVMPPGWAFGVAWTALYILLGLAIAIVITARDAPRWKAAVTFFLIQLLLNLAWSPLFFGAHQILAGLILILAILAIAAITTALFARVRGSAALLMLPYLAWLIFAAYLNYQMLALNPEADALALAGHNANIRAIMANIC